MRRPSEKLAALDEILYHYPFTNSAASAYVQLVEILQKQNEEQKKILK
jgi:hypothetical protein